MGNEASKSDDKANKNAGLQKPKWHEYDGIIYSN